MNYKLHFFFLFLCHSLISPARAFVENDLVPGAVLFANQNILRLWNFPLNNTCSAIMLEGDRILTAAHCLQGQESKSSKPKKTGIYLGQSMVAHNPKILSKDLLIDLALLEPRARQRPQRGRRYFSLASPRVIVKAAELYVVGLRTGIHRARITVPPGKGAFMEMEPIRDEDIICEPGDSGGAVVDDRGALIGLISGGMARTGRARACRAISLEYISKFLRGQATASAPLKDLTAEQAILGGDYSLRINEYEKSIAYYEEAAKKEGGEFEATLGRCALEKKRENYEAALAFCRKASNLKPSDLGMMELLGEVYLKLGQIDLAYDYTQRVLTVAPNEVGVLIRFGEVLEKQQKFKAAMAEYSKVLLLAHLGESELTNAYGGLIYCSEQLLDFRQSWRYVHMARNDGVEIKAEVTDWLRERMPEPPNEDN